MAEIPKGAVQAEWEAKGIKDLQRDSRTIKDLAMENLIAFSQITSNT